MAPSVLSVRFDDDVQSESFELADEPPGLLLGRAAPVVPVRAEIVVGNPIANDVIVGEENVVAGRADGFLGAPSAADLSVVGGQIGAVRARGGLRSLSTGLCKWIGSVVVS